METPAARSRGSRYAALALLAALSAAFYWQIAFTNRYTWLENPDQALQVRPWLDYEAREWHAGRVPLWDPYEWGGQSLIGQVQPGVANPLNWPLFAIPLADGHLPTGALHWYWIAIHWAAAALMFWLCHDLGAGIVPSMLGAAIYALAGFLGHSDTPQFLMGAVWIPAMLLFLARVGRGERVLASSAWCGAALGAAFLGGHHNIPIYTSVVLGGLWLWQIARHWRERRIYAAAAVFGLTAFLVAAVQILPAIEYGRVSLRWAGAADALRWHDRIPYSVHAENSMGVRGIAGLALPGLASHAEPFVGAIAMVLAVTAMWAGRRRWEVRMLTATALAGLLLALGGHTPVHRLAYAILPMVEKARYPAMAIAICQAALAPLAALGIEQWRSMARPLGLPRVLAGSAVVICGYAVVCRLLHRPTYAEPLWPGAVACALLTFLLPWRRMAPAVALAAFFLEALAIPAPFQPRDAPGSYARTMEAQSDIADFLRRQPGWFRVDLDEDAVPYNFGDWYGMEQFGSYTASMPESVHALLGHAGTARLFGVAYRVAREPLSSGQVAVFQSRSGLKVFRNADISAPLRMERAAPCGAADRLVLTARTPERTVIEATAGCPGLLVVGDPWFSGWRARVDGRPSRIQRYEGVIRALPLEAGAHRIEFRYWPGSVMWGAALSLLGLALVVFLQVTAH